jgi:hypothetical protein
VQTKLIAVLVVPVVAFLNIAGVFIGNSVRQSTEFGDFARDITIGREIVDLVHALQTERDHAAGYLALSPTSAQRQVLLDQLTTPQRTAPPRRWRRPSPRC